MEGIQRLKEDSEDEFGEEKVENRSFVGRRGLIVSARFLHIFFVDGRIDENNEVSSIQRTHYVL